MLPVLINLGPISVTSFGFFLALSLLVVTFLIWRLAKAWDLNQEKVIDLVFLSFLGGLIGARVIFSLLNFNFFSEDILRIVELDPSSKLNFKYPGFSFWGAIIGASLAIYIFTRKLKISLLVLADLAAISLLAFLFLGNLGCFLGGCNIGKVSNLFFATPVVGVIGNRLPIALLESVIFFFLLIKMWKESNSFHFSGKIASLTLIYVGTIRLILEFFKQPNPNLLVNLLSFGLSLGLGLVGLAIFYSASKRDIYSDLKVIASAIKSRSKSKLLAKLAVEKVKSSWYNQKIGLVHKSSGTTKFLRNYLRVKPTPKNIQ